MNGSIHQINISPGGVPKMPVPVGNVTRSGLAGDACANPGIHGGPAQALSLFSLEVIESLAGAGHPIAPGTTGENLTIRGLDWARIEPGMHLRLGEEVRIGITSYANPCKTIAGSFLDGNVSLISQRVSPGHSRLYAEVLHEGLIRAGDAVLVEPAAPGRTEDAVLTTGAALENLRIGYVNLYVTDLARSVGFFRQTLGLGLAFSDPGFGFAMLEAGPVRLGLAQIDGSDPQNAGLAGRHTGIGFMVEDLAAAHRVLAARGVRFPMLPARQPWGGFMALFEDPDGNVFYLDEVRAPGS